MLVIQLRQGDRGAFQQLYLNYYVALLGTINHIVKDPIEAEDLLQDTYVKVWIRFQQYDSEQSGLFNWLFNIARNTALDALRRRKINPVTLCQELIGLPMTPSCLPVTDIIGVEHLVRQVLQPQQWQVVNLAYWYGYSYPEIADHLALPLGTVKTRIRQSLIRLRPLFDR
ncbi:RNA polymerase sigma factor [Spirosoma arcticum]